MVSHNPNLISPCIDKPGVIFDNLMFNATTSMAYSLADHLLNLEIVIPIDAFTANLHSRYAGNPWAGNLLQNMEARQTGNIKPHYKLPYIHYPIVSTCFLPSLILYLTLNTVQRALNLP